MVNRFDPQIWVVAGRYGLSVIESDSQRES
jgi:hypothetical protein